MSKQKITLEFDELEDRNELYLLNSRHRLVSVLTDIRELLRTAYKRGYYEHDHSKVECIDTVDKINEGFNEILQNYHIDIELLSS